MSRVVVMTTEPLPLPGVPATGAGLRAWGLAEGLKSRGHDVRLLMAEDALLGFAPPAGDAPPADLPGNIGTFVRAQLAEHPFLRDCDAAVLQHWSLARHLEDFRAPLAIDLAGPHLLERRLWGSPSPEADLAEKLAALRRADFVTTSGRRQRDYFLAYLAMAGWTLDGSPPDIPVIPFSLKADAEPAPARGDRFVYGGFFLPWQDPASALETALDEMDRAGRGELIFVGGPHPHADVSRGRFDALERRLAEHPRVKRHGAMSYERYLALLREGGVALDLMTRNPERELAFPTRTVQYLACGLPVVHADYDELGPWIAERGAGWVFDPEDREGLRALLRGLLEGSVDPAPRAEAARRAVAGELDWDRTIEPLDRFCREPALRRGRETGGLDFEQRERRLEKAEAELRSTRSALDALLGKRWVRWGLQASRGEGPAAWPAALAAICAGIALFPIFWINDRLRK